MMEAIAVVAAANSAYNTLKSAISNGREIADLAPVLGRFWDAKESLSAIEQRNKHPNLIEKTFGAKSVEAQALHITLHKNKITTLETELKELFIYTGNGNLWEDMMRERRHIRNRRAKEARERAMTRRLIWNIVAIGTLVFLIGILISLIIIITFQ